jgi:hypothetical protein
MEGIHPCDANLILPEVSGASDSQDLFCSHAPQKHSEASLPPYVIEHSNESSAASSLASAKDTGYASSLLSTPSYPGERWLYLRPQQAASGKRGVFSRLLYAGHVGWEVPRNHV